MFCRKGRRVPSQYIFAYRQILISDNFTAGENTKMTWVTSRTSPPPGGLRSGRNMVCCLEYNASTMRQLLLCFKYTTSTSLRLCWRQESSANMAFLRFLIKRSCSYPTPCSSTIYIILHKHMHIK